MRTRIVPSMHKRLAIGLLWFVAVTGVYELASVFVGAPRGLGALLAVVVTVQVVLDPGGLLWSTSRSGRRRGRPSSN